MIKLTIAAKLVGKRVLPAGVAVFGQTHNGFLRELHPESILRPGEMWAMVEALFEDLNSGGESVILSGGKPRLLRQTQPGFCRSAILVLRDHVVYVLSKQKWRFDEIDVQLAHMGLPRIPSKAAKWKITHQIGQLARRYLAMNQRKRQDRSLGGGWFEGRHTKKQGFHYFRLERGSLRLCLVVDAKQKKLGSVPVVVKS